MEFLFLLGKFLFFTILGELIRPKRPESRNAAGGLKDLSFPTVDPTRPHQWLIGKRMIDNANLFATFDFLGVERSKKVRTGIISSERVPLPPVYYISAAMVLCAGSGARLREVWVGDRLAWSGNIGTGQQAPINIEWTEDGQEETPRGVKGVIEFYSGHSTPSPYIESKRGAGNVPSWKHMTYAVLRGPDGGVSIPPTPLAGMLGVTTKVANGAWIGTSKQVEHLKFVVERMPTAESTGLGAPADAGDYWTLGDDANPAYAAAEILTNRQFGAGIDPGLLDVDSFHAAAKVLKEESHGTSQLWDNQRVSGDVVLELMRQTGMLLQPDPVTGQHKLRLLRETEEAVINLDDSNIKRIHSYSRAAMDEATNALALEYTAATEKWEPRPVEVQDLAAIEVAGQVITGTASYAGITNSNLAQVLALRDLRALSAPLATVRLDAIVGKRQRFIPGDPVNLTATDLGIVSLRMRVTSARYAKPGESVCELELVEDVFKSGIALYTTPSGIGMTPPGTVGATDNPSTVDAGYYSAGLIHAPYALTQDDADHAMHVAFAPNTRTQGYDLGWYESDPATAEYHDRSDIGFSALGSLQSNLAAITAPASITVAVDSANAATLARFTGRNVLFYIGDNFGSGQTLEMLQASSVSVNEAGTVATLTGVTRGLWDSVPLFHAAGSRVVILCDYVIDPRRVETVVYGGPGQVAAAYAGQTSVSAVAVGRTGGRSASNGSPATLGGMFDDFRATSSPPGYVRAALPYPPGDVRLEGTYGDSRGDGTPPSVRAVSDRLRLTFKPRNRKAGGLSAWSSGDVVGEDGVLTSVQLAQQHPTTLAWTVLSSAGLSAGVTQHDFIAPTSGARRIRVSLYSYKPVSGTSAGIVSKSQDWYFTQVP